MNRKKLFFAGAIGNTVEVFEKVVYGFLKPLITATFFPENLRDNTLLFFFTLIIPVLIRPIGAIFFGILGDLKGRKAVLETTMIISGISCALVAFIPSYQEAGMYSFISLLVLRLLFVFSMAGEYNNSFLYLAENAEPKSRGFIISWASFGVSFGIFWASLLAYVTSKSIELQLVPAWSFRILFLFSMGCLFLGYRARKELSETAEFFISFPSFENNKTKVIINTASKDMIEKFSHSLKIILMTGFGTHVTYSLIYYAPFHLVHYDSEIISFSEAISLIIFYSLSTSILQPLFGKLSDIIGRKFLLLASVISLSVLYLFFFFILSQIGAYKDLLLFYLVLSLFTSMYSICQFEIIESLPSKMRSTTNGVLYGIPSVIFGALSLPYFEVYSNESSLAPLIVLLVAIPLLILLIRIKDPLFKPTYKYLYELEKAKIS